MAQSAVSFLLHKLSALLHPGQKFLQNFQDEIVYIKDAFEKMKAFSRVADANEDKEDDELQLWIKQVQDLAHDVQDILEKHVVTCSNFQEKGTWTWKKPHHSSLMSEKKFEAQNDNLSMLLEGIKARVIVISAGHKAFLQKYGVITSDILCSRSHEDVPLDDDVDLVGVEGCKSVLLDWLLSD